jgi:hypothetical protein
MILPETLPPSLRALLERPRTVRNAEWSALQQFIQARTLEKKITIEVVLFLIGIHVSELPPTPNSEKEHKEALIMEGTYAAFEALGVYRRVGREPSGFWIWERLEDVPPLERDAQETLLKDAILAYFHAENLIPA